MRYSWVEPDTLLVGASPWGADDLEELHRLGVRAVLSLTERPLHRYRSITPELLEQLDIRYFHVPIADQAAPTMEQAEEILQIIAAMKAEQRPLLFHCQAGIGRTGTVLRMYYLAQGLDMAAAKDRVREVRRPCILLSQPQEDFLTAFAARQQPGQ